MPAMVQLSRSKCHCAVVYAPHVLWSGFQTPKILLALFALFISGMAIQAQSTIPPAFAYQIVGNGNGLVLDVLGAQTGQGTPVDIALSVPSASNQTWQFAAVDAQHYQIASSASGKVLDVYGAQTVPGTVVDIAMAVPGAANQEWQLVQLPYYEIISRATGMVLDV